MIAVFTSHHFLHAPSKEIISDGVMEYGESPERAEMLLNMLKEMPGIELIPANAFAHNHFRKIHTPQYLEYLETAYAEWTAAGLPAEGVLPEFFALGDLRRRPPVGSPLGKAGYYMTDSCSMIVEGTWDAVRTSAYAALTGARYLLQGERFVFSLCRPPGHHAGRDFAGGYCFLNNAAIAAKFLQDGGDVEPARTRKIAILDIDFHHANGTQNIVQRMENMLLVSIHGDPVHAYPYLTGYVSENSEKNINFPLPEGVADGEYLEVFREAVAALRSFAAESLVVSLGVDTFEKETLGTFRLSSGIYRILAEHLLDEIKVPILIVMEGGYNREYLAGNVRAFLEPINQSKR